MTMRVVQIPETIWRTASQTHARRIRALLAPGLLPVLPDVPLNPSKRYKQRYPYNDITSPLYFPPGGCLDPQNPIYNFLIEYYGIKGIKNCRRLVRWSPPVLSSSAYTVDGKCLEVTNDGDGDGDGGVMLIGATEDDVCSGILHLRGAQLQPNGVLYNPSNFFRPDDIAAQVSLAKKASSYQWYRSVLSSTLSSQPILHCFGLHEWAMQYHPLDAPPPPSAQYQSSLPLRVSRDIINKTVERKGIDCTHVDALRFFAPAAGPLNSHGHSLVRTDQLKLEQKGCVHAHMDLFKICLKLLPFVDARLLGDCLEVALEARRLDVAASPYDASGYGLEAIPIETSVGRAEYKTKQMALMKRVEPIRRRLLGAYDDLLTGGFSSNVLELAEERPEKAVCES